MNFNVSPYYDDFDETKNYHQILFRPGFPVQSRELTQIQSILQNQIKKFGNHIFKNGTVVAGGDSAFNSDVFAVRLTLSGGFTGNINDLISKTIKGETSKVSGRLVHIEDSIYYVLFTTAGEDDSTKTQFENNEFLSYWDNVGEEWITFGSTISSGAVTPATLASIRNGIFYWGGYFINVNEQNKVISSTSNAASGVVTLDVSESIIDDLDDESLRDPALGYSNENAPGAHRYNVSLSLNVHSNRDTLTEKSIILFELVSGKIERLYSTTDYADIMKMLARRTYEESGNYTSVDYQVSLDDHATDSSLFTASARGGISFIGGYEVNNSVNRLTANIARARDIDTVNNSRIIPKIGSWVYISDAARLPSNYSYIQLRNNTITTPGTPAGDVVGIAKVRYVESSDLGVNDTFKLYLFDVEFFGGKSWENVASFDSVTTGDKASGNVLRIYSMMNVSGDFNTTDEIIDQSVSTKVAIPVFFDSSNKTVVAKRKTGSYQWPTNGSFVKQNTTNITGTVRTNLFINDPLTVPSIFNIPADVIASTSDYIYTVKKQITSNTISGGNAQFNLPASTLTNGTSVIGYISDGTVLENITIPNAVNTFTISGLSAYNGSTLTISVNVEKTSPTFSFRNKTFNPSYSISGITPRTRISLNTQDAYSLVSITTSEGVDITDDYKLVRNTNDCLFMGSYLELKQGAKLRTGVTLTIVVKVFSNSTGDFATVDSYSGLGTDYVVGAPTYKASNKNVYSLGKTFDNRAIAVVNSQTVRASVTQNNSTITLLEPYSTGTLTVGLKVFLNNVERTISSITNDTQFVVNTAFPNTSDFTIANAVLAIGYNSNFRFVDDNVSDPLVDSMPITFDYSYYLGRIDLLCIGADGVMSVYPGRSAKVPKLPTVDENSSRMYLASLTIPPYTKNLSLVAVSMYSRPGYTMQEINALENRIANVEETLLLSLLEQQTQSEPVIDPVTGLDRFKSGFVVESFNNHAVVDLEEQTFGDINNSQKTFMPWAEESDAQLVLVTGSSNVVYKDDLLMLDYTANDDIVLVNQPAATTAQNINPFTFFKWNGQVKLTPTEDFWKEVKKNTPVVTQTAVVNDTRIDNTRVTW